MTLQDVRTFWNNRPCNMHHSKVDIDEDPLTYSREVTAKKYHVEPHIPTFSQFARWKDKRVLIAGCGIGTMALSFAAAGAQIVAVDISGRSLEIALQRAVALGLDKRILFLRTPIEELIRHYPSSRPFDLVYSFGVIHHTPVPKIALNQLARYLIPGEGKLKLMLYNRHSWKVLWIMANFWRLQMGGPFDLIQRFSEAQTGCPVTHTFTRASARALVEDCGFAVTSLTVDHIFPYRVPAYIDGRYEKELLWRLMPAAVFRWLEKRIGWHMLIDAKRIRQPRTTGDFVNRWRLNQGIR